MYWRDYNRSERMQATTTSSMSGKFAAFSDPTRLRLLHLLRDGEVCVGDLIVAIVGLPQPTISTSLALSPALGTRSDAQRRLVDFLFARFRAHSRAREAAGVSRCVLRRCARVESRCATSEATPPRRRLLPYTLTAPDGADRVRMIEQVAVFFRIVIDDRAVEAGGGHVVERDAESVDVDDLVAVVRRSA